MKIILPKTLAEPLTIPWITVFPDETEMVKIISKAMREQFRYLRNQDLLPKDNEDKILRFSNDMVLRNLVTIAQRKGAINIESGKIRTNNGYMYWVDFGIPHRMGNKYSDEYSELFIGA